MSPADYSLLAPALEPVDLPKSMVLAPEGEPLDRVYFPDAGIGSVVAVSPKGAQIEIGLFGLEGFCPVGAVLGLDRVQKREFMHVGGWGHAIARPAFDLALDQSGSLRKLLGAYTYVMLLQASYTALSNAVHHIDERLGRWLLMCDDRTSGVELALTHEFISVMLGVRRPSVTTALHVLEGNGFIRTERGAIVIQDRAGLEQFASDGYGAPEREYRRLIGSMI